MIAGSVSPLLLGSDSTGYNLTRSLRTRASASANLSQTLTTSATWALSVWVKRGVLSSISPIFGDGVKYLANDTLTAGSLTTTAVYRDPSSFYHLYVSNLGLYINGLSLGAVTTASLVNPRIGSNGTNYFDGELAEFNFINGATPAVTAFGSFDSLTGVWKAARYSGSYPTGSSYVPFTDNSALTTSSNVGLGKDFSGNGNYWTTNNISITAGVTYDSMTDVPTLTSATASNFAVLNPLNPSRSTLTNGNLTASGTTDTPTIIPTSGTYYFEIDGVSKTWTPPAAFPAAAGNYNFGQQPFTNSPTNTLLNTFNLPNSTIVKGSDNMSIALAAGASIKATTEALFSGQFLEWIKDRANVNNHQLLDGVRGLSAVLQSNTTAAETTYTAPSGSSVGWAWKAGSSASSNTSGTITSTVSVNTAAGFSTATFTTPASGSFTVGHGLGVAPALIIPKARGVFGWPCYHASLGNTQSINLDLSNGASTSANAWNNTSPSSSVITFGSTGFWGVSAPYVAYCWTPIAGYSAFGSYVANGSADGVFVYLGFRPKFLLLKESSASGNAWFILDTTRDPYNVAPDYLQPNTSSAESAYSAPGGIDFLSNGFKLRTSSASINTSGSTIIYAAFAENPLRNSLAR